MARSWNRFGACFAAKILTYRIERCTFPSWGGINRTANIAIDTENELNQTSAPVQDPLLGPITSHLIFKRARQAMPFRCVLARKRKAPRKAQIGDPEETACND
jgi:hypothetical protein